MRLLRLTTVSCESDGELAPWRHSYKATSILALDRPDALRNTRSTPATACVRAVKLLQLLAEPARRSQIFPWNF